MPVVEVGDVPNYLILKQVIVTLAVVRKHTVGAQAIRRVMPVLKRHVELSVMVEHVLRGTHALEHGGLEVLVAGRLLGDGARRCVSSCVLRRLHEDDGRGGLGKGLVREVPLAMVRRHNDRGLVIDPKLLELPQVLGEDVERTERLVLKARAILVEVALRVHRVGRMSPHKVNEAK